MDTSSVAQILTNLADYYHRDLTEGVLSLYMVVLRDVPADQLQAAVTNYITSHPNRRWLPRADELLEISQPHEYPGVSANLDEIALDLEDDFTYDRRLDLPEWRRLIVSYEDAGRHNMAEFARRRLAGYQQVLTSEQGLVADPMRSLGAVPEPAHV